MDRHRRSIRLSAFDYRTSGAYFVTICTHHRECALNDPAIKQAVKKSWARSACDGRMPAEHDFVVMPNHIHGVVWIAGSHHYAAPIETVGRIQSGSLGTIVRAFKGASTKWINSLRGTPGAPVWQRNYYEHVIRNDQDLHRVGQYILENPAKWNEDHDNPSNWERAKRRGATPPLPTCRR